MQVRLPHHVVELHPGAGHEHAPAATVRRGHRGRIAVGIGHADLGRAANRRRPDGERRSRLASRRPPSVGDGDQGHSQPLDRLRRAVTFRTTRQLGERRGDDGAAKGRRRVGRDGRAAVPVAQRFALHHGVRRQVRRAQPATAGRHRGLERTGHRGVGEAGDLAGADPVEEARQLGVAQRVAGTQQGSAGREQLPAGGTQRENAGQQRKYVGLDRIEHGAVLGQPARGRDHRWQREPAESAVDV